ncbi:uncharacterized protein LOC143920105 [Arctopsyche grandis]|uniref:uncharacterized protein LOC143920105 n=1 Tax=Arctopsyche grandis TaxID=121162 RepID=UPI00406D642A
MAFTRTGLMESVRRPTATVDKIKQRALGVCKKIKIRHRPNRARRVNISDSNILYKKKIDPKKSVSILKSVAPSRTRRTNNTRRVNVRSHSNGNFHPNFDGLEFFFSPDKILRYRSVLLHNSVNLSCFTTPAPFVLRPFAGLYNPFSYGCSILCNHPADAEIKDVVKRAKDALITEIKNEILGEDYDTVHATIQHSSRRILEDNSVDFVPEELFRRYTETDSRPLTPAPTLASAVSRSSIKRRCLTPDHPPAPKQTLVLDLRRSHSQETLYWHGYHTSEFSSGLGVSSADTTLTVENNVSKKKLSEAKDQLPPMVSPVTFSKRSPNMKGNISDRTQKPVQKNQLKALQATKNASTKVEKVKNLPKVENDEDDEEALDNVDCEDESLPVAGGGDIRRRGRRRKGRNRLMSAALISTDQNDPETQIAGIGSESHNPSSRESVAANEDEESQLCRVTSGDKVENANAESFLEPEILKYLQREVDHLAIETEFDPKRRIVLEEAYRTRSEKSFGKEMQLISKEVLLPPVSLDKWLHLPRVFSRRNAIFSLPIDRRQLDGLLPMQYISEYLKISSSKKLLYRIVLEKVDNNKFYLPLEKITEALQIMMGEALDEKKAFMFKSLLKWDDLTDKEIKALVEQSAMELEENCNSESKDNGEADDVSCDDLFAEFDVVDEPKCEDVIDTKKIHFRTWCGLCALCERLYGELPSIEIDPPYEVEIADFDTLQGKLMTQKIDDNLSQILLAVQNTHS